LRIVALFIALAVLEATYFLALTSLLVLGTLSIVHFMIFSAIGFMFFAITYVIYKLLKLQILIVKAGIRLSSEKLAIRNVVRKPRKRYLIFQVLAENTLSKNDVEKVFNKVFNEFFGILGGGEANPKLVLYDDKSMRGVLRFVHTQRSKVLFALAMVSEVTDGKIGFIPLKITGTLRKAKEIVKTLALD